METVTNWVYLPGLGTGTASTKGRIFGEWLQARGATLRTPDLRVPDFRTMQVGAMLDVARAAVAEAGAGGGRVGIIGTSLGGYVAARVAAEAPVAALVLLAPALEIAQLRAQRPLTAWLWDRVGWVPMRDKTEGRLRPLGSDFLRGLDALPPEPPRVTLPTLLVHGTRDRTVPVAGSRRFAEAAPHVRYVEVDDGHHLFRAMPRVLDELGAFAGAWLPAGLP